MNYKKECLRIMNEIKNYLIDINFIIVQKRVGFYAYSRQDSVDIHIECNINNIIIKIKADNITIQIVSDYFYVSNPEELEKVKNEIKSKIIELQEKY